eukprot:357179-Chlamydomonas_euryale.AAC.8
MGQEVGQGGFKGVVWGGRGWERWGKCRRVSVRACTRGDKMRICLPAHGSRLCLHRHSCVCRREGQGRAGQGRAGHG